MSKHRIRDRRKRIRKIKRIRRGILSGIAVAGVVTIVFISWSAIAPETDETPESIATEIHIETKKEAETETPRTYRDVEFVPLPVPMTDADQEIVFGICQKNGVAFTLVMAIIEHESDFDRTARSQTGDSGYMQINDCNAESMSDLGFSDLYDLEQNVGAGVHILKELFSKYEGDVTFVLMAYNAGEKGARNMRDSGIYETEYTVEILERAEAFSSYIDNATTNGTDVQ
jgi:hypothetical protein